MLELTVSNQSPNFTGGEAREAKEAWQQEAASQQC